jgi:hypothetical protein
MNVSTGSDGRRGISFITGFQISPCPGRNTISMLAVPKVTSSAVTVWRPMGNRSSLYSPRAFVVVERSPSEVDTFTVTPGRTPVDIVILPDNDAS